MDSVIEDQDYMLFKKKIFEFIGLDLNSYKQKQMHRRLNSLLNRMNIKSFHEYFKLLQTNEEKLQEFKNFVTINVTEFFRNPEKFDDLIKYVLPDLVKRNPAGIKLWSAGCSNGAEPYTLSIIMQEYFPKTAYSVLATDIDNEVLIKARQGHYGDNEVRNLDERLLKKYFKKTDKYNVIGDLAKKHVTFKNVNLLRDQFQSGFDLILCRNVVIYFTEDAKNILYKKFYEALKPDGVLFVGGTENILNARDIGFSVPKTFFYKKDQTLLDSRKAS